MPPLNYKLIKEGEIMNFVPKERSKKTIDRLISERQERKRKEKEEMEKTYEESRKKI